MQERQFEQVLLAQQYLGPVFPLWGVQGSEGQLRCECGKSDCGKIAAKHPRCNGWQKEASDDPGKVIYWNQEYPQGNFGLVTGRQSFALDVDVRPEKNGLYWLQQMEIDAGRRVPYTVEVSTGRENGSHHLYFQLPPAPMHTKAGVMPGLDVRGIDGYCVAPGSRHIGGGYYRFAEECSPDELPLAELPDFLLAELLGVPRMALVGAGKPYTQSADPFGSRGPDKPLSDAKVLGVMRRDRVARFYLDGGRKMGQSCSEDDLALACKLAFYCRHNLPQMYKLFMRSGLYREKFNRVDYVLRTLNRAIEFTPVRWIPKKRPSKATGAKKGRRLSPEAAAILKLHAELPSLKPMEIATRLGMATSKVRDTLYYNRNETRRMHDTNTQYTYRTS